VAWRHGGYIAQIYVDSTCQGKGIGTALLNEVVRMARGPVLEVKSSLSAAPFYVKYGFVPTGEESELNGIAFVPWCIKYQLKKLQSSCSCNLVDFQ
jgi:GNAT superfamily N-acetyltransferase